jgi:hypothetical protein
MNPYQQAVTEQTLAEIRRQADIAGQSQAAQAVRTGAFGGTREGVQRAEMERNVQNLMAQQIAQGYAQNYAQAQQAAMQADEAARQRQLGIGQLLWSAWPTGWAAWPTWRPTGRFRTNRTADATGRHQLFVRSWSIATGQRSGKLMQTCNGDAKNVRSLPAGCLLV